MKSTFFVRVFQGTFQFCHISSLVDIIYSNCRAHSWGVPRCHCPLEPRRPVAHSRRQCNSCDDSASAFELPPATYNNLQVSGSTNRAGTQDTRQRNTHTRSHAARRSQVSQVVFKDYTLSQMVQYQCHSRPTLI